MKENDGYGGIHPRRRNFHVIEMINSINSNYGYEALKINENAETN